VSTVREFPHRPADVYDKSFFEFLKSTGRDSAAQLVPILVDTIAPASVVDVGCGTGTWLAAFKRQGVEDIFGLDGEWVETEALEIPPTQFRAADLTKPFTCSRTFDLAVSLEVAEHLPEQSAEGFVHSLVNLAPVVVFSAAIPFQGGDAHLNEQWPDYWAKRFRAHGYVAIDYVRPRIWGNPAISWWYAQNTLVFCTEDYVKQHDWASQAQAETQRSQMLAVVHPDRYEHAVHQAVDPSVMGVSALLAALPAAFAKTLQRKLQVFRTRNT